jgi:C-terminal processing protease CtpA/Prc
LKLLWFKDGIFIVNTAEENGKILGHKIVKINGKTIDVIVDSLSTVLTVDNRSIIKNEIPNLLTYVQLLGHFGIADSDNIKLQLENQQGETLLYEIKPAYVERKNIVSIKRDNLALYYQNEKAFFIDHNLKTDNVYYLKYNQCWSRENPPPDFRGDVMQLPSFQEFQNRVIETIKNSSFDKVVFDLRNNSGGSSAQGKELIRRISAIKDVNERGKLYVVLGRRTFSSAVLNAFDFKEMTKAIFVGEETSGKPNHFGEVRYFTLPGSGLKVFYSTNYFKRSKEDLTTIIPDYIIESNFKDYKEGRDPVYEWILKQ